MGKTQALSAHTVDLQQRGMLTWLSPQQLVFFKRDVAQKTLNNALKACGPHVRASGA
jgi:hypothetical protein